VACPRATSIAVAPAPSAAARRVASSEKQLAAGMTRDRRERKAALRTAAPVRKGATPDDRRDLTAAAAPVRKTPG
jgi:hypothetical protein